MGLRFGACSWVTAGQYLAAWVVCFSMMASAYLLAAFLVVHQWVLRRKLDSFYMHRYFQVRLAYSVFQNICAMCCGGSDVGERAPVVDGSENLYLVVVLH